jgi:hypothetical protein
MPVTILISSRSRKILLKLFTIIAELAIRDENAKISNLGINTIINAKITLLRVVPVRKQPMEVPAMISKQPTKTLSAHINNETALSVKTLENILVIRITIKHGTKIITANHAQSDKV